MGPVNHDYEDNHMGDMEFDLVAMCEPAFNFDNALKTSRGALANTRMNRSGVSPIRESIDALSESSPPVTPRAQPSITASPRMPSTPREKPGPPLLQALCSNSLPKAQKALDEDPEAAASFFWDNKMEPPLCCAVRLGCDVAIVALLLKYGADVNATDVHCRTPLDILRSVMRRHVRQAAESAPFVDFVKISPLQQVRKEIESLLLAAGAKEERCPVDGDTVDAAPFVFTWDAPGKNFDLKSVVDELSSLFSSMPVPQQYSC
jgi:hypothetical protein